MKIKTIDIQAKEWWDKSAGNSYFSAIVTLNYGLETETEIKLPFQYGYDSHYEYEALKVLREQKVLEENEARNLRYYCRENNIILRSSKQDKCLKRDVLNFVK